MMDLRIITATLHDSLELIPYTGYKAISKHQDEDIQMHARDYTIFESDS